MLEGRKSEHPAGHVAHAPEGVSSPGVLLEELFESEIPDVALPGIGFPLTVREDARWFVLQSEGTQDCGLDREE